MQHKDFRIINVISPSSLYYAYIRHIMAKYLYYDQIHEYSAQVRPHRAANMVADTLFIHLNLSFPTQRSKDCF